MYWKEKLIKKKVKELGGEISILSELIPVKMLFMRGLLTSLTDCHSSRLTYM